MHSDDTLLLLSVPVRTEQRVRTHQNVGGLSIEKLFHKTLLDLRSREMSYITLLSVVTYKTKRRATEGKDHALLSAVAQTWGLINGRAITRGLRETGRSVSHLTFWAIEPISLKSPGMQMCLPDEVPHPAGQMKLQLIELIDLTITFFFLLLSSKLCWSNPELVASEHRPLPH